MSHALKGHCIFGQCTNTKVQGAGLGSMFPLRTFECGLAGLILLNQIAR